MLERTPLPFVVNQNLADVLARIDRRGAEGDKARKVLAEQLAKLSLDELRKIEPSLVGRLGPLGLAHLVKRSATLRKLAAGLATPVPAKKEAPIANERKHGDAWSDWLKREPLPWQAAKSLLISVVVAALFVKFVPFTWRAVTEAPVVNGEPICQQLDSFTGGCTYYSYFGGLTIERAAAALHMPVDAIAAANPDWPISRPLPPNAGLRVPARAFLNWR
jgi:hypothetical protein